MEQRRFDNIKNFATAMTSNNKRLMVILTLILAFVVSITTTLAMTFGNQGAFTTTWDEAEEFEVFLWKLEVDEDGERTGRFVEGAGFALYRIGEIEVEINDEPTLVRGTCLPEYLDDELADGRCERISVAGEYTFFTDDEGFISFLGLEEGDYVFVEVYIPEGFELTVDDDDNPINRWYFTVREIPGNNDGDDDNDEVVNVQFEMLVCESGHVNCTLPEYENTVLAYNIGTGYDLIVEKQVVLGPDIEFDYGDDEWYELIDRDFQFTVTFPDDDEERLRDVFFYELTGCEDDPNAPDEPCVEIWERFDLYENEDDEYPITQLYSGQVFYLRHNQRAVFPNLPIGTRYEVYEREDAGFRILGLVTDGVIVSTRPATSPDEDEDYYEEYDNGYEENDNAEDDVYYDEDDEENLDPYDEESYEGDDESEHSEEDPEYTEEQPESEEENEEEIDPELIPDPDLEPEMFDNHIIVTNIYVGADTGLLVTKTVINADGSPLRPNQLPDYLPYPRLFTFTATIIGRLGVAAGTEAEVDLTLPPAGPVEIPPIEVLPEDETDSVYAPEPDDSEYQTYSEDDANLEETEEAFSPFDDLEAGDGANSDDEANGGDESYEPEAENGDTEVESDNETTPGDDGLEEESGPIDEDCDNFMLGIIGSTCTFTLGHGQERLFEGLPHGAVVRIFEHDYSHLGYWPNMNHVDVIIFEGGLVTLPFINTYGVPTGNGDLDVIKTVVPGTGQSIDFGRRFDFRLDLYLPPNATINVNLGICPSVGACPDMTPHTITTGPAPSGSSTVTYRLSLPDTPAGVSFQLRHGERLRIEGLPSGAVARTYEFATAGFIRQPVSIDSTIIAGQTVTANFNNIMIPDPGGTEPGTGSSSIRVCKQIANRVVGDPTPDETLFTFIKTVNGIETRFQLAANECRIFDGLTPGSSFTVEEPARYIPAPYYLCGTTPNTSGTLPTGRTDMYFWNCDASNVVQQVTVDGIPVRKQITGLTPATAQRFEFILRAQGSAPMPATSSVFINGEGTATFPSISFYQTGVFRYTVHEFIPTDQGAYVFDIAVFNVIVTVTEQSGRLVADVRFERNGTEVVDIVFTNHYNGTPVPPTPPQPPVQSVPPQTGDDTPLAMWTMLTVLSGVSLVLYTLRSYVKHKEQQNVQY